MKQLTTSSVVGGKESKMILKMYLDFRLSLSKPKYRNTEVQILTFREKPSVGAKYTVVRKMGSGVRQTWV